MSKLDDASFSSSLSTHSHLDFVIIISVFSFNDILLFFRNGGRTSIGSKEMKRYQSI